jgi:hypothetical protein
MPGWLVAAALGVAALMYAQNSIVVGGLLAIVIAAVAFVLAAKSSAKKPESPKGG